MKRLNALSKLMQKELSEKYPGLECFEYSPYWHWFRPYYGDNENILQRYGYKYCYISVFDHWLNQDEAFTLLDCDEKSNPAGQSLIAFNKKLFSYTTVINLKPCGRKTTLSGRYKNFKFKEFASDTAYKQIVEANYWFPLLALPELDALYFPGKDLSHLLIYRNIEKIASLEEWAQANGLHILKHGMQLIGNSKP